MDRHRYRFRTGWRVDARPEAVHAVLERVDEYPLWWRQVREVRRTSGTTGTLRFRSVLPYDLVVEARESRRDDAAGVLEVAMTGDLEGWVRWTVTADGSGTRLLFEEDVVVRKPLMRRLAVPCRPFFRANHALMMRQGRRGLRDLLAAGPAGNGV